MIQLYLYTKKETDKVTNYKGIVLLSTVYKIYVAVQNEHLKNDIDEKIYCQKFKLDLERAEVPLTTYTYYST